MIVRCGVHDAYVGEGGLGEDAGGVAGLQGLLQRGQVIELHDFGGEGWIYGWADVACSRAGDAVFQSNEGFVHSAVVAPVEDQNFLAAGDVARETDGETIRVGGSQCELPVRQTEAAL